MQAPYRLLLVLTKSNAWFSVCCRNVIRSPVVEGKDYTSNVQFGTSTSPAFVGQVCALIDRRCSLSAQSAYKQVTLHAWYVPLQHACIQTQDHIQDIHCNLRCLQCTAAQLYAGAHCRQRHHRQRQPAGPRVRRPAFRRSAWMCADSLRPAEDQPQCHHVPAACQPNRCVYNCVVTSTTM